MSVFLIIAGVLVVLYGVLRPEQRLPARSGKPSVIGGSVIFGLLCVAGVTLLTGPSDPEDEAVSVAGTFDDAPEAGDGWPGGDAARDSTFRALAGLLAAERYPEAEDQARALVAQPYAAPWTDSLRSIAREAEELALLAQARRIPASEARANWRAYTDLIARFPDSPRLGEYVARREAYEDRLIEREAVRFAPPAVPEPVEVVPPEGPPADVPAPSVAAQDSALTSPSCCRVCIRGKACGNTCIAQNRECRSPPGCACQG